MAGSCEYGKHLQIPPKARNVLSSRATIGFLSKSLLHGVAVAVDCDDHDW
jgi:hypothetical protein